MRDERRNNVCTPLDLKSIESSKEDREEFTKEDWKELKVTLFAFAILCVIALFMFNFAISASDSAKAKENSTDEQFNSNGIANGDTSRR